MDKVKKYNIIYADPPWKFNNRNNSNTKFGGGVTDKYPTMSIEEIKNLNIPSIASDDCALLMWCTTSKGDSTLADKLQLFEHWGFRLVNIGFSWIKTNKNNNKPFFNVGHYTHIGAEHCFLGIKGSMEVKDKSVSGLIISPREEHSKKPDIVRDEIVKLFGDVPRIELFSRQKVDGWDYIGNDIDDKDIREVL